MKTIKDLVSYLESELAEAYEMHEKTKGKEATKSFAYLIKATTIEQLLEKIKEKSA